MPGSYEKSDLNAAIENCSDVLNSLSGSRLLLTGGTGFFGRWLLSALVHANRTRGLNAQVTVLTRSAAAFENAAPELAKADGVELLEGDVRRFDTSQRFTHIIHAATDTSQEADADRSTLSDVIISGTRNVLEMAARSGAAEMLYVSSGAVYGAQGSIDGVPETHTGGPDPLDQRSTYAESKRMAEHLCAVHAARTGLRIRVARCFAFVGPGLPLDGHFAIGNFIAAALSNRTIEITGDGTPMRSYLYAADLVAWLLRILIAGKSGQAYNVGSDQPVSIRELAEIVSRVVGSTGGVYVARAESEDGFRSRYVPDIDKARADLGLDVWTPLESAIAKTADWARRRDALT